MLPVAIVQNSAQLEAYDEKNDSRRAMELDLVEEKREKASLRMEAYWRRIVQTYNQRVRPYDLHVEDLVLKTVPPAGEVGKLKPKWEGP